MGIPKECKMPDLSGLDAPLMSRLVVQLLIGESSLSHNARLYRRNFVRLVDKALREYNEARGAILADVAEANRPVKEMKKRGREIHVIAFTDHIETCINAVSRLFKLLERIKSEKQSPAWPRELRRLLETKSEPIANIRDAVEHIDEKIQKGEIGPGKPIMLTVSENDEALMVANYEIKFEELAMVLKKMHEVAQYILTIKKMEAE
jgi:hypothetical protein